MITKKNTRSRNKETSIEQVKFLLEKISEIELQQFILDQAAKDPFFCSFFLSSFAFYSQNFSKEFYAKQIRVNLLEIAGRKKFITRAETKSIRHVIDVLSDNASLCIKKKAYEQAAYICFAIMEELCKALKYADDSNGILSSEISYCFKLLSELTKIKIPETTRIFLFNYFLTAYESNVFINWDWHHDLLRLAEQILQNEKEALQIISYLDAKQASDFRQKEAQSIKLLILKKIKSEMEVDLFIEQNLINPEIRIEAINNAILAKNYEKAIFFANDGIKINMQDNNSRLIMQWHDWLLKIALLQQDKAKILNIARVLFLDNFLEHQDYYKIMQNTIPKTDWPSFVEGLIIDINKEYKGRGERLKKGIFIKEKWWDRLLMLLRENPTLNNIEQNEKYLITNYQEEIIQLYEQAIVDYIKNNVGRLHYIVACNYLTKISKLGAIEKVSQIKEYLINKYPERKALIDELKHTK